MRSRAVRVAPRERAAAVALAACLAASVTVSRRANAQAPAESVLDFAPIDVLTLSLAGGLAAGLDGKATSADLHGDASGLTLESLGLGLRVLHLEVDGRPGVHTSSLAGSLLELRHWMVGSSTADSSPCLAWVSPLACADDGGTFGFGAALAGLDYDTLSTRAALRLVEAYGVFSPTPAYAPAWKRHRLEFRIGESTDFLWNVPGMTEQWVARLVVGVDALLLVDRYEVRPFVRWRPNLGRFVDDFGLETGLRAVVLFSGPGFVRSGERYQIGIDVGYAYWKVPTLSYGPDWLLQAQHSAFARVVFSAALASLTPPSL